MLLKQSDRRLDPGKRKLIAQAQSMLGRLGYGAGSSDGQMGPKTRNAIRRFQKRSGMKVTGDVSAELITRLAGLAG